MNVHRKRNVLKTNDPIIQFPDTHHGQALALNSSSHPTTDQRPWTVPRGRMTSTASWTIRPGRKAFVYRKHGFYIGIKSTSIETMCIVTRE